jgi:hypothetical protein
VAADAVPGGCGQQESEIEMRIRTTISLAAAVAVSTLALTVPSMGPAAADEVDPCGEVANGGPGADNCAVAGTETRISC